MSALLLGVSSGNSELKMFISHHQISRYLTALWNLICLYYNHFSSLLNSEMGCCFIQPFILSKMMCFLLWSYSSAFVYMRGTAPTVPWSFAFVYVSVQMPPEKQSFLILHGLPTLSMILYIRKFVYGKGWTSFSPLQRARNMFARAPLPSPSPSRLQEFFFQWLYWHHI
jgi:hypothetical protein